jgi:hypothetical protein
VYHLVRIVSFAIFASTIRDNVLETFLNFYHGIRM